VFFVFSCKKENATDCFKPNGKEVTEIRNLPAFNQIVVFDKMAVYIQQGPEYRVEISGGKQVLKNFYSEVKDSVLQLDNRNTCNFVRGYKRQISVKITVPYVRQITNDGVGGVTLAENFNQDAIFIRAENSGDTYINGTYGEVRTSSHGNGDIYIKGSAKRLMVYMNGTNFMHAQNLRVSDYVFISNYSLGDATVQAQGLGGMDCKLWSSGNIYYSGTPGSIRDLSEVRTTGKIIQRN
jgi:hypothetical protein